MKEYISKDILENEYMKSFSPLHMIQLIIGSCRVDLRDRFVTSPTFLQKVYTIICMIVALILYLITIFVYYIMFTENCKLFYVCLCISGLQYITYASSVLHTRFINNKSNVKFHLQLQELDREMGIHKNKFINDALYKSSLINVTVFLSAAVATFILSIYENISSGFYYLGFLYTNITCGIEWLYISHLITHLCMRLQFINTTITYHLDSIVQDSDSTPKISFKESSFFYTSEENHFERNETDVNLNKIFHVLGNFQDLYKFQVYV